MPLPPSIKKIINSLCAAPSDYQPTDNDADCIRFLARGTFGDVWAIDEYVTKIYRERNTGFNARAVMREEWGTYKALGQSTILPRFYECKELEPHTPHTAIGWAVIEKINGTQPAIDAQNTAEQWGARFAIAAATMENELRNCLALPSFWKNDDLGTRMRDDFKMKNASDEDLALANKLRRLIAKEMNNAPNSSRFLHGDLQFLNSLWDGSRIRLIDPGISYEPPEANLKRLPHRADFVNAFAAEYEKQTGVALNGKMLWAISALDQHEIYLRLTHFPTGEDPTPIRHNRDTCLQILQGL